jgi:hypothetical protein
MRPNRVEWLYAVFQLLKIRRAYDAVESAWSGSGAAHDSASLISFLHFGQMMVGSAIKNSFKRFIELG